ncbi:MBL fold metallo-hydrolase [Persicimonas caeni]|uniref:MBL fold metallo-hydrolase n=1 Tax=Persicimonas caeni TaxID=2292766 RepID=A0A4Y6PZS8_PERCE|nr:MBL fold metallo-hydrolase [Persicimonas caeni]QDG53773.1 MBL fold metallo-hydrolase [Persicimonas caeni]QED34994.1 MBL fold metallo-hydrolase [Persicimonas caeni]
MEARFLGHAAVLLTSQDGTALLVDPYNPGGFGQKMGYGPIPYRADAVVCSHEHLDHCGLSYLPNQPHHIEGNGEFGPFSVRRYRAFHDEYGGRRRGGAVDVLAIEADGMTLVHLSDVGHSPTDALVDALARPDVLFVPVGGFYTIGAAQAREWHRRLAPSVVIPLHYKTDRCGLPLRGRADFEAQVGGRGAEQGSCVELKSRMITFKDSVVLLRPEC